MDIGMAQSLSSLPPNTFRAVSLLHSRTSLSHFIRPNKKSKMLRESMVSLYSQAVSFSRVSSPFLPFHCSLFLPLFINNAIMPKLITFSFSHPRFNQPGGSGWEDQCWWHFPFDSAVWLSCASFYCWKRHGRLMGSISIWWFTRLRMQSWRYGWNCVGSWVSFLFYFVFIIIVGCRNVLTTLRVIPHPSTFLNMFQQPEPPYASQNHSKDFKKKPVCGIESPSAHRSLDAMAPKEKNGRGTGSVKAQCRFHIFLSFCFWTCVLCFALSALLTFPSITFFVDLAAHNQGDQAKKRLPLFKSPFLNEIRRLLFEAIDARYIGDLAILRYIAENIDLAAAGGRAQVCGKNSLFREADDQTVTSAILKTINQHMVSAESNKFPKNDRQFREDVLGTILNFLREDRTRRIMYRTNGVYNSYGYGDLVDDSSTATKEFQEIISKRITNIRGLFRMTQKWPVQAQALQVVLSWNLFSRLFFPFKTKIKIKNVVQIYFCLFLAGGFMRGDRHRNKQLHRKRRYIIITTKKARIEGVENRYFLLFKLKSAAFWLYMSKLED